MWNLRYPFLEGALLRKTDGKIQGHHSTRLCDVASQSPFVRVCICLYMCMFLHRRGSVCNSLHRARLCISLGAHFSSQHMCRHLSQGVCVRSQCLLAWLCVSVSDWSCIEETFSVCSERLQHHDRCTVRITIPVPLCTYVCPKLWKDVSYARHPAFSQFSFILQHVSS